MVKTWLVTDNEGNQNTVKGDVEFISLNFHSYEEIRDDSEIDAKVFRDQKLKETDAISMIFDHPLNLNYQRYRQNLRDWPSTDGFPDIETIPELDETEIPFITNLSIINRFTSKEYGKIEIASIDDISADPATRAFQSSLRRMLRQIETARYIDLDNDDLIGAFKQLQSLGFLTSERAQEILSKDISPDEKYKGTI